jgi:Amt family ammonium transporter
MAIKRSIAMGICFWMGLVFQHAGAQTGVSVASTPMPVASAPASAPPAPAAPTAPASDASAPAAVPAAPAPVAPAPAAAASAPAPAPLTQPGLVDASTINGADTAWMMTSTALVLLMTLPGIALFYGGMVRRKSVLNVMACVVVICAVVSILWFAIGYSLAFTPGSGAMGHFIGGFERAGFAGLDYVKETGKVAVSHIAPNIPESVYSMFQLTFAIITAALVVGAFVERMRFSAVVIFMSLWTIIVYAPIAHWVWEPNGWLARLGVLDFAGGSVVHVNAGIAGLVCAYVLGPRRGYGSEPFTPVNLGLTMAGAACCGSAGSVSTQALQLLLMVVQAWPWL